MDTNKLRQKILDMAIRGKLVPQDPNDEPASVLLERIRNEKQRMVQDGKLKKRDIKNDTIIFRGDDNLHYEKFQDGTVKCIEDEIPFEVPEGWCWARVRDIAMVKGGKRLPKGASFSEEITNHAYIRVTDMKNHSVNVSNLRYISDEIFSAIKNYTIAKDDLYVTIAGTIGVVGEIPDKLDGMNLTENAVKITNIAINKSFLCIILQTDFVQQQFQDKTHQVAMPKLALERILSTLIPICSSVQQLQIVDRFQICDNFLSTIDAEKEELQKIVSLSKSKILDLAIRGKLVPQDPNDEPASVLLERIRAEKEELIKQGKIKRDKKESVIFKGDDNSYYETIDKNTTCIDDEIPFIIPNGWAWCRLQSISSILTDGTHKTPEYSDSGYLFLSSKNVTSGKIDWENVMHIPEYLHKELYERLAPAKDDILLAKNGTTGIAAIVDRNEVFDIYVSLALIRIVNNLVFPSYVLYAIGSPYVQEYFNNSLKGIGVPNLHLEHIRKTLISIPPYSEQKQIAELLKNIFLKIDDISNTLS